MHRYVIKYFLFILLLVVMPGIVFAQKTKKELENRKKKLQDDIEYLNNLLEKTTNSKESSLGVLMTVNRKISLQEQVIETVTKEIDIIQSQIKAANDTINSMEGRLSDLKKEYARMVVDAYKTEKGFNKLSFIFASKDFEQAALRMRYVQEYQEYRHRQALIIDSTSKEVNKKVARLEKKKEEKKQLLESVQSERSTLDAEKKDQQKIYDELKGKEKQLRRELADKQKASQKLDASIRKLVEEEIRKSNASTKTSKKTDSKTMELKLTPEAEKLSENFESNKGKLPWPVVEGVIFRPFGTYSPMPGITMTNNGIDITTSKGAIARSVFEGTVSVVTEDPSLGKIIIIKHGQFYSVYVHLKEVFVKAGDKVQTKQTLGTIQYDEQNQMADLELEIWKGQNKLDPQDWLFKKD
ncbi:MAG TPA: peptidoglycan DD-metalloendopeptidase family protein [Bacteroidia bacterium]|nr:peptidoglycan DD-metalloendopeptidase family protein [Bacteroidia bacterium]